MNSEVVFIFNHYQKANAYYKKHTHKYYEVIYFLQGAGETRINNSLCSFRQGDICFISPDTARDHRTLKKTDFICMGFNSNARNIGVKDGIYSSDDTRGILNLMLEIKNEMSKRGLGYKEICGYKVAEMLILIQRLTQESPPAANIAEMIKRIDESEMVNLSVTKMAQKCSYSYDYFRHEFKRQTGLSPLDYIIRKRIEKACRMLEDENYTCAFISDLCGFSTPTQFNNIFKRIMTMTPGEYRKENKMKNFSA